LTIFKGFQLKQKAITTVFIAEVLPNFHYSVGITDILLLPEAGSVSEGRILTPAGVYAVCSLDAIREALNETEALRCDKPTRWASVGRSNVPTQVNYAELASELLRNKTALVPLPEGSSFYSFRSSVQNTLRRRGVLVKTKNEEGCLRLTVKEEGKIIAEPQSDRRHNRVV
jgi:hypothetical protein